MAVGDPSPKPRRLFITDYDTKIPYLIDTGADLCVYPRTLARGPHKKSTYELAAANGSTIHTYGTTTQSLNLGLRREFPWRFIIADVSKPIIGADFLSHFGLLVDIQGGQLIDKETKLTSQGKFFQCIIPSVKVITGASKYHQLLASFPEITRPDGRAPQVKHQTRHHIETTPGPPVACKARRLAPDRLSIAQKQFDAMVKLGTARPSSSSWAAPLHLVPKANNDWRPCGDYRGLNARTIPDRYPVRHIRDFAGLLRGKKRFSVVDLMRAFNQLPVYEDDIPKNAIIIPFSIRII
ncbi:uncharacterized protein LOC124181199 [Neodiprion fabricii]|uniref:uncharacterized protein LOC124181199 n=1 Tax=Neodiprion fabricii TaxID=2872261 RepID=UPI001ED8EFD9|nr:uncharacterized protein LOC124181199 [Neodiprion fabricii]